MTGRQQRETVRGGSDGSSSNNPVSTGELIGGKYRVDGVLGAGGVGVVVEATHIQLGELVAIKVLQPSAAEDPETVARFEREARASVRIKSDYVTKVLDVGELDSGVPYMVMEHLRGHDLSQVLRDRTCLPVDEAVEILLQACLAVAEAHALGIVHRDLKPANLFLLRRTDGSPHVKVLDFGISKILARPGAIPEASMTQTATVVGSPLYMSPEQMESARYADERSDIWSLGTILFELIAGVPAFEATSMPQLCARILNGSPTCLLDVAPDVPEALWIAVKRALERKPADRYAHVGELARELQPFAPARAHWLVDRIQSVVSASGVDSVHKSTTSVRDSTRVTAQSGDEEVGGLDQTVPLHRVEVSRIGTTTRPLTETRKFKRTPSRLAAVLLLGGIAVGSAVVLLRPTVSQQPNLAEPNFAKRGTLGVAQKATQVARDAAPVPVQKSDVDESSQGSASNTGGAAPNAGGADPTESATPGGVATPPVHPWRPPNHFGERPPRGAGAPPKAPPPPAAEPVDVLDER